MTREMILQQFCSDLDFTSANIMFVTSTVGFGIEVTNVGTSLHTGQTLKIIEYNQESVWQRCMAFQLRVITLFPDGFQRRLNKYLDAESSIPLKSVLQLLESRK